MNQTIPPTLHPFLRERVKACPDHPSHVAWKFYFARISQASRASGDIVSGRMLTWPPQGSSIPPTVIHRYYSTGLYVATKTDLVHRIVVEKFARRFARRFYTGGDRFVHNTRHDPPILHPVERMTRIGHAVALPGRLRGSSFSLSLSGIARLPRKLDAGGLPNIGGRGSPPRAPSAINAVSTARLASSYLCSGLGAPVGLKCESTSWARSA